jgi:hypothetical protein
VRPIAVIVLVGPGEIEVERLRDLVDGFAAWEPRVGWCVLVDDDLADRRLAEQVSLPGCTIVALRNPRRRSDERRLRPLGPGTLTGLAYVHDRTDAEFALKIDTDAIVIGPFADRVADFLHATPDAGMVGTAGDTCNPANRTAADAKFSRTPMVVRALRTWPDPPESARQEDSVVVPEFGSVMTSQLRAFSRVRAHVAAAVRNGYATFEYCQGGAYALSRTMIDRMAAAGYLDDVEPWSHFVMGEDVLIGMYTRAVGLRVCELAGEGDPFAIQAGGLPYPPQTLIDRGHSLVHGVKNDRQWPERDIRAFFARARAARAPSVSAAIS